MSYKNQKIIFFIIVAIAAVLLLRLVFSNQEKPIPSINVTVKQVKQKDVIVDFQAIGTVQAYSTVDVKSMVTGPLVKVGFKEGDLVTEGQMLFEIDQRSFQAAVDQAEANLMRDKATLANNLLQVQRNAPLLKKAFIAKQDYDTLVATSKSAQATVNADEAVLENAKLQLDYATIEAPISGKTGSISLKMGSVIKANDTTPLVTINQINPIYVTFSLSQDKLPVVQTNLRSGLDTVTAFINNAPSEIGKITFIDNAVAAATGTILLKATFPNEKQMLWPGQYVNVKVPLEHYKNALLVPTLAVMTGQEGFYVFVVDNQNIAHVREVTVGSAINNRTIILTGLQVGESVVIAGQLRLTDGMKVNVEKN